MRYGWIILSMAFFAVAVLAMTTVSAIEPQRLTTDFNTEGDVQVSDTYVVWTSGSEIHAYNIATKTQSVIYSAGGENYELDLQYDNLVWRHYEQGMGYSVMYMNVTMPASLMTLESDWNTYHPSIYGDYAVWSNRSWDAGTDTLYFKAFNVRTGTPSPVLGSVGAQNVQSYSSDLFGNRALFLYNADGQFSLFLVDASNGNNPVGIPLPVSTYDCYFIAGGSGSDFALCRSQAGPYKIDLKFGKMETIPALSGMFWGEGDLAVHGNSVVYMNLTITQSIYYDLTLYRLDTKITTRLTYDTGMEQIYAICNDKIAFESNKDGQYDVYYMVLPQNPPDLVIERNDIQISPAVPVVNEPLKVNAHVSNRGTGPASGFIYLTIKDQYGGSVKYSANFATLKPAESADVPFNPDPIKWFGYTDIEVFVRQNIAGTDPQEVDLGNNKVQLTIYLADRPNAVITASTGKQGTQSNEPVVLSGSNSTDRDGISLFVWDLGDGTTAVGKDVTHAWAKPGDYGVRLTVYDIYGIPGSATTNISILNLPPVPVTSVPVQVARGVPAVYSAAGSYDPDGTISEAYWEFDMAGIRGGVVNGLVVEYALSTTNDSAAVALHLFDDQRNETVVMFTVNIVDSTAQNVPPIAIIRITGMYSNLTFSGENSYDPNGEITKYTWTIDSTAPVEGKTIARALTEGTHIITLKVDDDEGLYGTTSSSLVINYTAPPTIIQQNYGNTTVVNQVKGNLPPNATASYTVTDAKGGKVSFTGSGSDKDGTIIRYEWDFDGDGKYDWSSQTNGNTDNTYAKAGYYVALFRVTDNNGTSVVTMVSIGIKTDEIGKPGVRSEGTSMSTILLVLIVAIVAAVAIAAGVGYAMSKKFAKVQKDEAAEAEVAEIRRLVEESKATGANVDEAEALVREFEGR